MAKAAESDPKLAARTKHYLYRSPFEFYDYEKDPDALNNLMSAKSQQERIAQYRGKLRELMQKTKDHETQNYLQAIKKHSK